MNIKKQIYSKYNKNSDMLLDILSDILYSGYEAEELAEIIKEDNRLFHIYRNECLMNNLLKKDVEINLESAFGGC